MHTDKPLYLALARFAARYHTTAEYTAKRDALILAMLMERYEIGEIAAVSVVANGGMVSDADHEEAYEVCRTDACALIAEFK